jgi:hypothetical protein
MSMAIVSEPQTQWQLAQVDRAPARTFEPLGHDFRRSTQQGSSRLSTLQQEIDDSVTLSAASQQGGQTTGTGLLQLKQGTTVVTTDSAKEHVSDLRKAILTQPATSVLAQANQSSGAVLSLFRDDADADADAGGESYVQRGSHAISSAVDQGLSRMKEIEADIDKKLAEQMKSADETFARLRAGLLPTNVGARLESTHGNHDDWGKRLTDADLALETTPTTRQQILEEQARSMLSQVNPFAQQAMRLLG